MKADVYYVLLPLVATLVNAYVVFLVLGKNEAVGVHGQHQAPIDNGRRFLHDDILHLGEAIAGRDEDMKRYEVQSSGSIENYSDTHEDESDYWNQNRSMSSKETIVTVVKDEDAAPYDPNMKPMAQYDNFEAYVRADISSYYREPTGSRVEVKPAFTGLAGKFVNLSPERLTLWWVDTNHGNRPQLNGDINPWGAGGTATFPGHTFIFTKHQQPESVLCTFHVQKAVSIYFCDPFTSVPKDMYKHSIPAIVSESNIQSLDKLSETDRNKYKAHVFNLQFGDDYQEFTKGSPWLTMYPPNKLLHPIWPAEYFGQSHSILTTETHFHSIPPKVQQTTNRKLSVSEMKQPSALLADYREPGQLNLTIKALSCTPKAFEIRNFLSNSEVDHLLSIIHRSKLDRSTTNGHMSDTRTSRTTWIRRDSDPIVNAIFRRVADVVRLDEAMLRQRQPGEVPGVQQLHAINEDLQVVYYDKSQQYTAHHDFGYPKGIEPIDKISRSMNLAMYLNDVDVGGQTSFPRWRNAETFKSIDVRPEKGKALLFYMVNPDGNLEDMSQHAALPVGQGEKYFANLWMSTFQ